MRLSYDTVRKALLTLSYVTGTTFILTTGFAILSQVGIAPICHKALVLHPHPFDSPYTTANSLVIHFKSFFQGRSLDWLLCMSLESPPSPV